MDVNAVLHSKKIGHMHVYQAIYSHKWGLGTRPCVSMCLWLKGAGGYDVIAIVYRC